jgi:hypothetical protein
VILPRILAVLSLVLTIAGTSWWAWACAQRGDWQGVALGLGVLVWINTAGMGLVYVDRGIRRLRRAG